ncbi:AraC family transcriptional regulator [Fluviicola sp.]|uniref:helix-turn-helix domain-containing protein n=1 Tax=Fluviicola sp. TaxID=1917219 RepID=UPI0031E1F293
MTNEFVYHVVKPPAALADFVESFWRLENTFEEDKEIVVVPDGRVDLFISRSAKQGFHITLAGVESEPDCVAFEAQTVIFAVSFKLLAIEYVIQQPIADFLNRVIFLPDDFWGFNAGDLSDFDAFCSKAGKRILDILSQTKVDPRKRQLFDAIYSSQGDRSVQDLSEQIQWGERQINRYFQSQFGISLKSYCTILRFRASFPHIKEGKLSPEQNFTDQAHFIREIKRFSGVTPKELLKNVNDRFIQFSTLPRK